MILPTLVAGLAATAWSPAPSDDPPTAPPFELRDPEGLGAALADLERRFPSLAVRIPIGRTAEGRAIEALRLARTPLDRARPALLLIAGLEAERTFEPSLVVELAQRLLDASAAGPGEAKELLEALTIYVVPTADPDGLARAFERTPGAHLGSGPDVDNDRDGRRGEDPWLDVDGDGRVLWMRVPDSDGDWIADPHDPRANAEAEPRAGRPGTFRLVREGRDSDGDGRVSEDPAGDRRFDANFPADWPEHEARAGAWATEDPSVRALCDFVIAREDLVMVHALGSQDWMVSPPSGAGSPSGRVPATGPTAADLELLVEIAERYRDATGLDAAGDFGGADGRGSFQRWAYDHRGLWTFAARVWTMPTEAPAAVDGEEAADQTGAPADEPSTEDPPAGDPSDEAGRLAWIDAVDEAWRFADWKPFDHPELGPVEIGGFAPGALTLPPQDAWSGLADQQLAFLYELADLPAALSVEAFEATALGDGVWELDLRLRNVGWLPTTSDGADRARTTRPTRAQLELPEGAALLAGLDRQTVPILSANASDTLRWIVRAEDPTALSVRVVSATAGTLDATPTTAERAR